MNDDRKWWRVTIDDYFMRKGQTKKFATREEQRAAHKECIEWLWEGTVTHAARQDQKALLEYFLTNLYKYLGVKDDE